MLQDSFVTGYKSGPGTIVLRVTTPRGIHVIETIEPRELVGKFDFIMDMLSSVADQELGEGCQEMLARLPSKYFYLSPFCDSVKRAPVPFHKAELAEHPEWKALMDYRIELTEGLPPHQRDYIGQTMNTFELYDMPQLSDKQKAAKYQRYDMVAETFDEEYKYVDDNIFKRLLAVTMLMTHEISEDRTIQCNVPTENLMDFVGLGQKNTAHAAMLTPTKTMPGANMTKSQVAEVIATEVLRDINDSKRKLCVTQKVFSMNPKDERVKPGKKVKQFQSCNGALATEDAVWNGAFVDRLNARPDLGFTIGLSGNGGTLDWHTRMTFGLASGKGYLTDEELEETKVYETDFEGYEYRHPPAVKLCYIISQLAVYAGHGDKRVKHLNILLASIAENKLLPDLLPGGGNLALTITDILMSGSKDTLGQNTLTQLLLFLVGAMLSTTGSHVERARSVMGLRNGDDGLYVANEVTLDIMEAVCTLKPAKLVVGDAVPVLSVVDGAGNLIEEGALFCKTYMAMDEEHAASDVDGMRSKILQPTRSYHNLHKACLGNRSTVNPSVIKSSCISNAMLCNKNKTYHELIEKIYNKANEFAGVPFEPLVVHFTSTTVTPRDPTKFPSYEDVVRVCSERDPEHLSLLMQNFCRGASYNVPVSY